MRRFAIAAGLILSLAAAESQAGYYIVRIVLEGGDASVGPEGSGPGVQQPGSMPPPLVTGGASGTGRGGAGEGAQPGGGRPGATLPVGPGVGGQENPMVPTAVADPNRSIVVVVPFDKPYENKPFYPKGTNVMWLSQFNHKYGRTNLFHDDSTFQVITKFQDTPTSIDQFVKKGGSKTYQILITDEYARWAKTKTDPQALFNVMVKALENGMVPEALAWAKELDEHCERTKPQLSARVNGFLAAYRAIKGELDQLPPLKNDAAEWKDTIDVIYSGTNLHNGKHYSVISWDTNPAELTVRFSRLEDHFKAFYLWHATQGITLKAPAKPQVVVLLKGAEEFTPLRLAFAGRDPKLNQSRSLDDEFFASRHDFAGMPPLADAFLAPHHNILVISPERTDTVGRSFRMSNRNLYREGMTRQLLLAGGGPPLHDPMMNNPMNPMGPVGPGGVGGRPGGGEGGVPGPMQQPMPKTGPVTRSKEEVARAQTTAFVERYDEDATELAAVSCEASRQLLFASEMFPAHVDLPIWLTTGAGEFYLRPRNPVYTPLKDNKATMAIGLTTGYGRPNFAMQYRFAQLSSDRAEVKLTAAPLLRNILTDAYFLAAANGKDIDNPANIAKSGPDELTRLDALKMKARVMSWALYYDLIKNQPAELMAFCKELQRLPRDVAIDRQTHLILFARSFGLLDDKGNINDAAFATFAENWYRRIRQVDPAWVEVEVTTPAPSAGVGAGPAGPGLTPVGPLAPRP